MTSQAQQSSGHEAASQFVLAVEQLLEPPDRLHQRAQTFLARANGDADRACRAITTHQSNVSAAAGGVAALPAAVPGAGTAAAVLGGTVCQMVYVMKVETEMCLMLASAFGFDIKSANERQLAMLLASVGTFEVAEREDQLRSLGIASAEAVFNYTPREVAKALGRVAGQLLVLNTTKRALAGVFLIIPIVGIGVGAGVNKVLTHRVGVRAHVALRQRRWVLGSEA